jgi:hypothetical protein
VSPPQILCSDGARAASAYVVLAWPPPEVQSRARAAAVVGSLPRSPHQMQWRPSKAGPVEAPDGRPATSTQRLWVDPDWFSALLGAETR